jgi:muconolactone delta-isomerase
VFVEWPKQEVETMEFLVEFDIQIPVGAPESEVEQRLSGEAAAAEQLARRGHLVRLWRPTVVADGNKALGLYRADSEEELDGLLSALPLDGWMQTTVTPLEPHPNDPSRARTTSAQLPVPRLTLIYRLDATLGEVLDLGEFRQGRRRIVPLTGGTFNGPELSGTLVPGASADWQTVLPDGTSLGDIRYTLRTESGDLLYVESRGVRYGSAEVLARLGRGDDVDPTEYTFRTTTHIATAAQAFDWMNKGVFIGVAGRHAASVTYETYLVG